MNLLVELKFLIKEFHNEGERFTTKCKATNKWYSSMTKDEQEDFKLAQAYSTIFYHCRNRLIALVGKWEKATEQVSKDT